MNYNKLLIKKDMFRIGFYSVYKTKRVDEELARYRTKEDAELCRERLLKRIAKNKRKYLKNNL